MKAPPTPMPEQVTAPAAAPAAMSPTYASKSQAAMGMGQRPNKLFRPVTGFALRSTTGQTSLLGG